MTELEIANTRIARLELALAASIAGAVDVLQTWNERRDAWSRLHSSARQETNEWAEIVQARGIQDLPEFPGKDLIDAIDRAAEADAEVPPWVRAYAGLNPGFKPVIDEIHAALAGE